MKISLFFSALLCYTFCFSQNLSKQKNKSASFEDYDLISSYEDYAEMEREVVYLHLNKSTFIKGEAIGIKAYIFDKANKRLSSATSNLYCSILDKDDKIVKQKLIMINNGIGINDFIIDSLFTSGNYKITAYTNWMKNFNEKNFYMQDIRIIDPEVEKEAKQLISNGDLDVQFLPEGGHLVAGIETIIGVTVKDDFGFGIKNVDCKVIDSKTNEITTFQLNQLGLGRFSLTAQANESYKVTMKIDEKDYEFDIKDSQSQGIGIGVKRLKDKTYVTFKTNEATHKQIANKAFVMAIHNGDQLKAFNFKFNQSLKVVKAISNTDLFSGINIITIFDANNTPVLERQVFNYSGLNFVTSNDIRVEKKNDSLLVSIPYKDLNTKQFNSFSISVLPSNTRAYNHHENISSSTLLQPYVKGYIENAQYYFKAITPKKEYELDNLLLTQGWSSYNWDTIFNTPPDYDYDFENGISYVANFTNNNQQQLVIYPTLNSPFEIIDLKPGETAFEKQGFFPVSDEKVEIGAINKKGKPIMPNIALRFSPDVIPDFNLVNDYNILTSREIRFTGVNNYSDFANGWKKIEQLDEVILKGKRKYTRVERIKNSTVGKVTFIDEKIKRHYKSVLNFIDTKGFNAYLHPGSTPPDFVITNRKKISLNASQSSIVYLDGMILQGEHTILIGMSLDDVEYIETNSSGIGGGMRGGGGIIKIKTNPFSSFEKPEKKITHKTFEIPLKFDVAKRFYIPKYTSYNSDFFREYGLVDWFSDVSTNEAGVLNLKVFDNKQTSLKLFIEGMSNDGTFISEVKEFKIK
ncbi:hypothetical protein A9Q86_16570 [Flavobacteriales bacterium 33_180_T64]|nr:hypothetical protein A9Q86_16570 [Flavobacteriales bacterium 33_180_T64]